jgi:glutamate-1-semialdehyde 2,1-aminomutase
MKHVMPAGPVFQAGTLSGNPLAMAAGVATLQELRDNQPYVRLDRVGQTLAEGLSRAAGAVGIPHVINRAGSMWTFFFTGEPVYDYDTAKTSDTALFARFFWGMMDRGVYLPCSQFEAAFLSTTHTDELIRQTIAVAAEVFEELARPA